MSKRVLKRVRETAADYEQKTDEYSSSLTIQDKDDDELFQLDRVGSKSTRRRIGKEVALKADGKFQSVTEKKLIQKALSNPKRKAYGASLVEEKKENLTDLWIESDEKEPKVNQKKPKKNAILRTARPGQSYNPSSKDHNDIILEAAELEAKKLKREAELSNAITEPEPFDKDDQESEDDSSDENDDDDNDDNNSDEQSQIPKRMKTKRTIAEKNRRKAAKKVEVERLKLEKEKKLMKSVNTVPELMKKIKKSERISELQKKEQMKEIQLLKERAANALSYQEVGFVPLTDEMSGSLRQIVPKGFVLRDRASTMLSSGKLMDPSRRKRKSNEKPHAAKRVVWIPKYKY